MNFHMRKRTALAAAGAAFAIVASAGAAWALWIASDSGAGKNAYAYSDTVGAGSTPTASATGSSVAVSWTASTSNTGRAVTGYLINRYSVSTGGTAIPAAVGTCSANPVTSTTCTETSVPGGTWHYTVTPVLSSWKGAESPRSIGTLVAAATKLAFTTQPSSTATSTVAFSTQPVVTVQDAAGATVSTDTSSVSLAVTTPGGATLTCTANPKAAVAGVATFAGCQIDKAGTYTLTATDGSLTAATSTSVTITAGAPAKLAFGVQPTNTPAAASIAPSPTVQIQDAFGNLTTSTASVTVAIGTNPGSGTLSGTTTIAAINGLATFNTLSINKSGTGYTLTASGSVTAATSSTFNITAGAASKLVFGQQPTSAQAGASIAPSPTVQIQDAFGNPTTSTANVTMAIGTNPGSGTLSGTTTIAAINGLATFNTLSINKVGTGYTLTASGSVTAATSNTFNITVGAANRLVFAQQPTTAQAGTSITPSPTVQVLDSSGNLTASTASVTMAIGTNPGSGTLSGSVTVAAVNGTATFSTLSINKSGTGYTLAATSGTLVATPASSPFSITVAAASRLKYVTDATGATESCPTGTRAVGNAGSLTTWVAITDAFGNLTVAPNSATTVTLTRSPTSGGGNAPTPTTLTVNANASPAVTSGSSIFTLPNGNPSETTYTATAGAFTTSCIVKK